MASAVMPAGPGHAGGHGPCRRPAARPWPDRAMVTRTQPDTGSLGLCLGASTSRLGCPHCPGSVPALPVSRDSPRPVDSPRPRARDLQVRVRSAADRGPGSGEPGHGDPSPQAGRAALAAESLRELGPGRRPRLTQTRSGPPRFPHRDGTVEGNANAPIAPAADISVPNPLKLISQSDPGLCRAAAARHRS